VKESEWRNAGESLKRGGRRTLKKSCVDPLSRVPYCISVCFARSSAFSIGVSMRSTVRNAARLAVYGIGRVRLCVRA